MRRENKKGEIGEGASEEKKRHAYTKNGLGSDFRLAERNCSVA